MRRVSLQQLNWEQYLADFNALASIGQNEAGGMERLAFSEADQQAHKLLAQMAENAGFEVKWDGAGNLWITRRGTDDGNPDFPPLLLGSHMDTVPDGGKYDGLLGVMTAFHAMRLLDQVPQRRTVTLIVFRCEESSRFNCATIGSKLLAEQLTGQMLKSYVDKEGISAYDAIRELGGNPDNLYLERKYIKDSFGFIEMHIEQGPVLGERNTDIGIVNHIAAPHRFHIIVKGTAAHSGACPMGSRNDALTGAAEIILAVERLGREYADQRIVATVGKCDVINGAMNIVPGHVELYVDIRGIDQEIVTEVVTKLHMELAEIASKRNLSIEPTILSQERPVKLDDDMAEFLVEQCLKNMLTFLHMVSGAGHDTMYMAKLTRAAMFFVPCEKGISHNRAEAVTDEAVQNGLRLMYATLVRICTLDPEDEREKAEMDRLLIEEAYQ
ncbi:MAG: M20 family metallo-hydrolase [Peptococcaceae bacterium]|nr:M20 family metallo-hydrolase [Peptococcaceae bacterium]